MSLAFAPEVECPTLKVIGPDWNNVNGTYHISPKKADISPSKPMWKKPNFDRYIYYHPVGPDHWHLGNKIWSSNG